MLLVDGFETVSGAFIARIITILFVFDMMMRRRRREYLREFLRHAGKDLLKTEKDKKSSPAHSFLSSKVFLSLSLSLFHLLRAKSATSETKGYRRASN